MVILKIHDLFDPLMRVDPVRSFLALEDEPEGFSQSAEIGKSEAGGIVPGQLKEPSRPHSDIVGDIIEFVNAMRTSGSSMPSYD
jgi:hypothetical protein